MSGSVDAGHRIMGGWSRGGLPGLEEAASLLDSAHRGYILALGLALALPVLRFFLERAVFGPLGRACFFPNEKKTDVRPDQQLYDRLFKFKESAWKASFYLVTTLLAFYVGVNERFFTDTRYFWLGCTKFPPCNYDVSRGMRLLYCLELAYYVQAVPTLLVWEVRRKDFWEQLAHHLATIALVTYSYEVNFIRVGTMVFLCHDVCDVWLEAAKMARYAKHPWLPTVLFGGFTLTWFTSRMTYFPLWVIRSVYYEPLVAKTYNINPHPHWEIFLSMLCFLFALHIYWSYLIIRVIAKQLGGAPPDDVREDSD